LAVAKPTEDAEGAEMRSVELYDLPLFPRMPGGSRCRPLPRKCALMRPLCGCRSPGFPL